MKGVIKENGSIIKCMEEVHLNGEMGGNMLENILKIKNMDMEFFLGKRFL